MSDAKQAIGEGNLDQATEQQNQALDSLRKGAQATGRADGAGRRDAARPRPRQ